MGSLNKMSPNKKRSQKQGFSKKFTVSRNSFQQRTYANIHPPGEKKSLTPSENAIPSISSLKQRKNLLKKKKKASLLLLKENHLEKDFFPCHYCRGRGVFFPKYFIIKVSDFLLRNQTGK